MAAAAGPNQVDMAMSNEPKVATPLYEVGEKQALAGEKRHSSSAVSTDINAAPVEFEADLIGEEPTEEELRTLRRVSGKIPWQIFTIAFVELCERFGYYGCQVLCKYRFDRWKGPSLTEHRHQLRPAGSAYHRRCRVAHWQGPPS